MEIDGQVAGGIQYHEENDPMYRHAGIDIYPGSRFQGQGAGREAVALLARYLFDQRGHRRITIDPAAANDQAIRSYNKVGFRPVGVHVEAHAEEPQEDVDGRSAPVGTPEDLPPAQGRELPPPGDPQPRTQVGLAVGGTGERLTDGRARTRVGEARWYEGGLHQIGRAHV